VEELAPGLRRWSARHEEWEEDVNCLALDTSAGRILIDPLDPPEELRRPEHVLLTVFWHGRSTRDLAASRIWASSRSAQPLRNRGVGVTDAFRAGDELPAGIQAFQTARASEVVYWLPDQRALAVGDVLLGAGAKPRAADDPLRLCPERWLGKATHEDLRNTLRPLLHLPIELILPGHGAPVRSGGHAMLAHVLN
jgi:hypothetical protein